MSVGLNSDLAPYGGPGGSYDNFGLKSTSVTVQLTGVFANGNRGDITVKREIGPFSDLSPSGTPGGRYAFSNTRVVELSGLSATASLGSITATGSAIHAITTTALTSGLGTITGVIPVDVSVNGVNATGAVGDFSHVNDQILDLTTSQLTSGLGDIAFGEAILLGSQLGTTGLGSLTVKYGWTQALTGIEGTASSGTITLETQQKLTLTAVAGTSGLGSLTTSIPPEQRSAVSDLGLSGVPTGPYTFVEPSPVTVSLTGLEATTGIATFDGLTTIQEPDGSEGTSNTNDLTEISDQVITPTGVSGTGAVGGIEFTQAITLTGVSSTALLGSLTASTPADVNVGAIGNAATGTLGTLSPVIDSTVSVTGAVGTGVAGLLEPNFVNIRLTGVKGTGIASDYWYTPGTVGRVKKRKRRYLIEVDGEYFEVANQAEAQAIFDQIRELAREQAETNIPVEPVKIAVKTTSGKESRASGILSEVRKTRQAVDKAIARQQARIQVDNEIAQLMQKAIKSEQEEEDAILALLL